MNNQNDVLAQLQPGMDKLNRTLQELNLTPQQYLEQKMLSGEISQQAYDNARIRANQVLGTKY